MKWLEIAVVRDDLFRVVQTTMDAEIDGWIGRPTGISMSYRLAGEFLRRGLLLEVEHKVDGAAWLQRSYRGQLVQPDRSLDDFDYYFGVPVIQSATEATPSVLTSKRR